MTSKGKQKMTSKFILTFKDGSYTDPLPAAQITLEDRAEAVRVEPYEEEIDSSYARYSDSGCMNDMRFGDF